VTIAPERQAAARPAGDGYAAARKSMIESQLRTSGVNASFVLHRMMSVPREDYVPASARPIAYIDRAVPLGEGRFLAAPVFHGMLLQEAVPGTGDRVLVVDGGSGYLPDLVRPLVASLDVITPAQALQGQGQGEGGGGGGGGLQAGGFSLLLIDGAVEHVPAALAARLDQAGRAVTGVVESGVTRLAVGRRTGGMSGDASGGGADAGLALLSLAEIGIPILTEFAKPKAWSF